MRKEEKGNVEQRKVYKGREVAKYDKDMKETRGEHTCRVPNEKDMETRGIRKRYTIVRPWDTAKPCHRLRQTERNRPRKPPIMSLIQADEEREGARQRE